MGLFSNLKKALSKEEPKTATDDGGEIYASGKAGEQKQLKELSLNEIAKVIEENKFIGREIRIKAIKYYLNRLGINTEKFDYSSYNMSIISENIIEFGLEDNLFLEFIEGYARSEGTPKMQEDVFSFINTLFYEERYNKLSLLCADYLFSPDTYNEEDYTAVIDKIASLAPEHPEEEFDDEEEEVYTIEDCLNNLFPSDDDSDEDPEDYIGDEYFSDSDEFY